MKTYSELSIDLTKRLDKSEKKENGIYFTPPKTVSKALSLLTPYMRSIKDVLEPSCGSCEFVRHLVEAIPDVCITAVEYNKIIYEAIKSQEWGNVEIHNSDYLAFQGAKKYDLIIGNPPYYVMKKGEVAPVYYDYFEGRPNIFILFIAKALQELKADGILAFVLPKNFLNCLYYNKMRKFIYDRFQIMGIHECDDSYIETQQETILLILRNASSSPAANDDYCLIRKDSIVFGAPSNIEIIKGLYHSSTTLKEMGFEVKVGNIVWNQCKDILTDDSTKTLLIYSSDIKNGRLELQEFSNEAKKHYICKEGELGPRLLLNRGYGVGKYKFEYYLLDIEDAYLLENHVIYIRPIDPAESKTELLEKYHSIIRSFQEPKTQEFIEIYFGNNAINTTELCELLPIYLLN